MKVTDLHGVASPLGHTERIKLFGWWLHTHGGKTTFQPADVGKCYDQCHIARPGTFGPYFAPMVTSKQLLKNPQGYRLEGKVREALDKKHGQKALTVEISEMLRGLPAKLPNLEERTYLDEAMICYRNNAMRAAIVMTWNLAYAHLCDHVVKNRLADFNVQWQQDHGGDHRKAARSIIVVTDFADEGLAEHKVLTICSAAKIITKNVYNVLEPALKKRNAAAHPNDVSIKQHHVDAFIDDVITNAVLKIV